MGGGNPPAASMCETACDVGWSPALFRLAQGACEAAPREVLLSVSTAVEVGVGYEALCSLWHQQHSALVRKAAHGHRERVPEYVAAWEGGESLAGIAARVGFSPALLEFLNPKVLQWNMFGLPHNVGWLFDREFAVGAAPHAVALLII